MYKALSPSVLKEMTERGHITVTIKAGWENQGSWSSTPGFVSYCIGSEREHIFRCYFSREPTVVQITNVEATKLISKSKSLVDAYMYVALAGLVDYSKSLGAERFIFDTYIPGAADHMLDLGFRVTGTGSGSRGLKIIKKDE